MRLANLTEFRNLVFSPRSVPCLNTLRARIKTIPGGALLHGRYYVDLDEFNRVTGLRADIENKLQTLTRNPRLDGLI